MAKNYESTNNPSASKTENPWTSLEELGKTRPDPETAPTDSHPEVAQDSQESKTEKLDALAEKVRDIYRVAEQSKTPDLQPQPDETATQSISAPVATEPHSSSLVDRIKTARQNRQANKSINLIQKLATSRYPRDTTKLYKLAESGKFNFANQQVSETFLETVRDASAYRVDQLIKLGISPASISQNEHMQSLTLAAFRKSIDESLDGSDHGYHRATGLGEAPADYSNEILASLLSDQNKKERLVYGLDIQKYGDEIVDKALDDLQSRRGDNEYNRKYKQTAATNLKILKQLGFVPLSDDASIPKLFDGYSPAEKQEVANEIGLINDEIVDRMYAYKYEQTLQWMNEENEQTKLPDLAISQQLVPSPDSFGNYWREQSQILGEDAMAFGARYAKVAFEDSHANWERNRWYSDAPEPKLEDFINHGKLQDKFFEDTGHNSPIHIANHSFHENHNGYNKTIMNFLASNIDKIHGENKGLIKTWAKIHGNDEKSTDAARLAFMKYATGDHNIEEHLFDENGPTENFFEKALIYTNIDQFMPAVDENWQEHYSAPELAYIDFHNRNQNFHINYDHRKTSFREAIGQYFDQNGPNQNLAKAMLESQPTQILEYPEILSKLPEDEWPVLAEKLLNKSPRRLAEHPEITAKLPVFKQQYISFLSANNFPDSASNFKTADIEKYFDDSGPKPDFWAHEFAYGDFETILKQDEEIIKKMEFDAKQSKVLETYSSIEDRLLKIDFKEFVMNGYEDIPISRIAVAPTILNRLGKSNASEITAHRSAFAGQLLRVSLDDDQKMFDSLERVEDVFVHNNLPFVGKAFLSFQILHPSATLDTDFDFSETSSISPSLKEVPNNATQANSISGKVKNREAIIFSDLLKASFGSNNRSIREYLNNLKKGQTLINQLSSGEINWDKFNAPQDNEASDKLQKEREALSIFAQHLNTIYNNTEIGRKSPRKMTGNLEQDVTQLVSSFSPTERHSLSDRIVRSFAYFAGVKDFAGAEALLDATVEKSNIRNREAAKTGLKLEKGDFVKGIGSVRYLPNILQNGSVAKEFLGESAGSDRTPLDTDLSVILGDSESISAGFNGVDAGSYGPVWIVLKGDGNRAGESRFSITRRSPEEQNQQTEPPNANEKIEAFYTGVLSKSHYGIRTGFGSSEIDFFVSDLGDINGTPIQKVIGLETALNGFYIPVVDKTSGEVVFSPEEYDEIRAKMSGLDHYGMDEYHFAKDSDLSFNGVSINGTQVEGISQIVSQLAQNESDVRRKHAAIDNVIDLALGDIGGLTRKNRIDGDLTNGTVELIDTGSTGRFDNAPGSGDFDYMMRVDKSIISDPRKLSEISNALLARFGKTEHDAGEVLGNNDLRLKGVQIEGLDEPVDIDISFTQKTNKVQYSTDMALADRLETIRAQSPEKHQQVVANIIFAKKFLKAAEAYKPNRGEKPQGGLGGVGVENWVLQNGGSFLAAAKDFMAVANQCSDFDEFCSRYTVWDFGENHMAKGEKQHDNFVADNMSSTGYEKMKAALASFLSQQ